MSTVLLEKTAIQKWLDGGYMTILPAQLFSAALVTVVICLFCIVYNVKVRNRKEGEKLSGFLVFTDFFITACENLVISTIGIKYRKWTPFAMYMLMYIALTSFLSLLGFEPFTTSYTVPLSMGLVTFFGIYYFGIRYQKLAFFKKYLINPLELVQQFVPLISISFRLFGNMMGGSIILGLLYSMFIGFEAKLGGGTSAEIWNIGGISPTGQYEYWWSGFNIFTTAILPWLHMYFDLFDGGIQAFVFTMLTLSYWKEQINEEGEEKSQKKVKIKKNKQLEIKNNVQQEQLAVQGK